MESLTSKCLSKVNLLRNVSYKDSNYLTHLVLVYQYCGQGLQEICNLIASLAYQYIIRDLYALEDDAGEFLLSLYHKLPNLITRFRYYGIQFNHYLSRYLRLEYRSFKIRKQTANTREYIMYVSEELHYFDNGSAEHIDIVRYVLQEVLYRSCYHRPSNSLRLLLIALKFSSWISKQQMRQIAKLSSIPYQQLCGMCERLRIMQSEHQERYNKLQRRRNSLYSRMLHIEYTLNQISSHNFSDMKETEFQQQLSQLRERLARVNHALRQVPQYPSNNDIANLLSVSKGTVDSALYFLRKAGGATVRKKMYSSFYKPYSQTLSLDNNKQPSEKWQSYENPVDGVSHF